MIFIFLRSLDDSGKKTPDEVVKRHGVGHGNNPDLMAEMKEKRASMVHQVFLILF